MGEKSEPAQGASKDRAKITSATIEGDHPLGMRGGERKLCTPGTERR